ncbi:putative minor capsid protein [Salinithrix halophila]|uniref:Minor capsid protein n=1 Tax=Salinithrix halophila TaxID=1485204 RepID=A0ABV8JGW9_9BACL
MGAKPIPRHLLLHRVQYQAPVVDGGWNTEPADPITISNVRVSTPTVGEFVARTSIKDNIDVRFVLYLDAVHSSPFIAMEERGRVTWEGQAYEIVRVSPMYDDASLHHYEVGLR